MTASDPRVGEIQARLAADWETSMMGGYIGDDQCMKDRDYLLAELADRDEKLARVLEACDRIIDNTDGHKPPGPPNPSREQVTACRIRAIAEGTSNA